MNILLLSQVFPPATGGSGRWLWELYRRLAFAAGSSPSVHVAAGESPAANPFDAASALPITRVPLSFASWGLLDVRSPFQYARTLFLLRRLISQVQPDRLHCGKCLPEGLLASAIHRWNGIPFEVYTHGEELTLAETSRELARLTRHVLHRATRVIANSRHTKQLLVDRWTLPADRIVVMHPGVDTSRFVPAPPDPAMRERLGWTGRRVILTVGALQKRKGQDMLIRALPAIRARCPDVLYAIVGEGWERAELEQLATSCGVADSVQFRGVPGDEGLVECYQQCDLFVLPNRQVKWDFEGFGIVLLEAQACGKPVIAGASGGAPETIDPPRTGESVQCDTPEPLAQAAADLLEDPARREAMGLRARQWAVDRFDWNRLAEEAVRLFDE